MKKVLEFFNLLDNQGKLSITNLAVIVVLSKLIMAPAAGLTEAVTLLIALVNYGHKRMVNNKTVKSEPTADKSEEINQEIEKLKSQLAALNISVGVKNLKGV